MNIRRTELIKREKFFWELLTPLGFDCQHSCRYRHIETGAIFDFSATEMTMAAVIHVIIKKTQDVSYREGNLGVRADLARLIDIAEDTDTLNNIKLFG